MRSRARMLCSARAKTSAPSVEAKSIHAKSAAFDGSTPAPSSSSVRSAIQTSKTFLATALTVSDSPLTVTPAHEDRLPDRPTVSGSTWRPLTLEIATTATRSR
jgi:hypothetical protein